MLQAIIGALCGVGLFFVLADVYRIPYLKTSKAVESLSKKLLFVFFTPLSNIPIIS